MQKFVWKKWAVVLTILLFPSVLYILFSGGKHGFKHLPYYGPRTLIVGTADTLYHSVNAPEYFPATDSIYTVYSLVTPNGDALDDRLLNQLMFTHRSFDKRTDLQFVTLTWPKSHENITWRHSQEVAGRDTLRWKIVEMPLEQLKAFASHQLLLGDTLWPPLDVRRNMFVITDKRGHIRSYIDASQYTEGKKLRDDLKVLKAEEFVPKKREK